MEAYERRYRWHRGLERVRRWLRLSALLALTAGLVYLAYALNDYPPKSGSIGQAEAIDGDSLRLKEPSGAAREIRLAGIDAVEYRQTCRDTAGAEWPCGKEARAALAALVRGDISCTREAEDRFARAVSSCRTAAGADIAGQLVAAGWAVAGDGDSASRFAFSYPYRAEEAAARAAKRGIWRGSFMRPALWRAAVAASAAEAAKAANAR